MYRSPSKDYFTSFAICFIRHHGPRVKRFTSENLAIKMRKLGRMDFDQRWMGGVMQRAKRAGMIKVLVVRGKPVKAWTNARHHTPVWQFVRQPA